MHITLILLGLLAGICLYVSIVHAVDAKIAIHDRRLLLFAIYSFLAGIYGVVLAMTYQLNSPAAMVTALKWNLSLIALTLIVFPWFVLVTSGFGSRRLILLSNVLTVLLSVVNIASPYSLQYAELPSVKAVEMPWGETIWESNGPEGAWFITGAALVLVLQIYAIYAFGRMYRTQRTSFSLLMLAAALLTLVAISEGILVRMSIINSIHLGAVGALAVVVIMSTALNQESGRRQKDLQDTLRRSQALQKAIFDYAGYAIISGTPEGIITSFNPAAERMLGYTAEELVGKQTPEIFHDPGEVETRAREFSQQLGITIEPGFEVFVARARLGLPNEYEWSYVRKNGSRLPVLLTVTALRDIAGEITGFLGVAIDISEHNRALQALRESEQKYRLLFENMTTGFALHEIICDDNGDPINYRYLEINPAFEKLTGVPASALLGKTILEVMPNTEKYWIEVFGKVAMTGEPVAYENYSRELGRYYNTWVFSPRKNQFAVIFSDISDRKRAEAALRNSEIQLRSTLDNTPGVAVQWFDRNGRVKYWNTASEKLYAIAAQDAVGKTMRELLHTEEQSKDFLALISKIESQGTSVGPQEGTIRSVTGAEAIVLYTMFMIPGDGNQPIFVCMDVDITERKRAEAELQSHRDHLEELVTQRAQALAAAYQELEAFSYSVSHDLRAPLRSIDGFAQILAEDYADSLDEPAREYLQRIRSGSQRMSALIDDLLQLARIGRAALSPGTVDLSAMARDILAQLSAGDPKRQVRIKIAPGIIAYGDEQLLHVVMTNLLNNAWKYTGKTQDPHIEFGQTWQADEPVYYVRDNGAGFDMQFADKLFGAFQRLHTMEEFPGTGIGLATVQRVIRRHGGKVWVQAETGKGATFYFTLSGVTGHSTKRNKKTKAMENTNTFENV